MNVQESFDGIVESVGGIVAYARQKALYEADCRVREELERMRRIMYTCESVQCRKATVELARCKVKLKHLRGEVDKVPIALKVLFNPLVSDLESRIIAFRKAHMGYQG